PAQRPYGSRRQVALHPFPSRMPASSQVSSPAMIPSPHVVVQTLGSPRQVHPGSVAHSASHPSPGAVPSSSQVSSPATIPSPQLVTQVVGSPSHDHPASRV